MVIPIWDRHTSFTTVLMKLKPLEPSTNVFSGLYGVLRILIVQKPHRALAASLLIPGVRQAWRKWAHNANLFVKLRALSRYHKQTFGRCEESEGECRSNRIACQRLYCVHEYIIR